MLVPRCMCSVVRIFGVHIGHEFPWQPWGYSYSTWYRKSDERMNYRCSYYDGTKTSLLENTKEIVEMNGKRFASKKAKNKKKSGGGGKASVVVDTSVGEGVVDLNECKDGMLRSVEKFKQQLQVKYSKNLTVGTVDNFFVSVNGKSHKLMEVAEVKQAEKEFHVIPMVNSKNIEKQIIEAIERTGLKLNPRIHEGVVKVTIPVASTEYRGNLFQLCKASAEKSRVELRKIRQQTFTQVKRNKDSLSKDEIRLIEKQIDILFDSSMQRIDNTLKEKSDDLK